MKIDQPPISNPSPAGEIALLLRLIDEGYEKKAWHGPNLKGSIRGLSAQDADWRPRTVPAFDRRERRALRLLEIRRSATAHRRKTRFICTQGKQLVRDSVSA